MDTFNVKRNILNSSKILDTYKHAGTVVIKGDLETYLRGLERYFEQEVYHAIHTSESQQKEEERITFIRRNKSNLEWAQSEIYDILTKNQCESLENLEAIIESSKDINKDMLSAQKYNLNAVRQILNKSSDIMNLDIINYSNVYHINRIRYGHRQKAVLINVFYASNQKIIKPSKDQLKTLDRYAQGAKDYRMDTRIMHGKLDMKIPTLQEYVAAHTVRTRTIKPKIAGQIPIICEENKIYYNIFLNEREIDILRSFTDVNKDGKISMFGRDINNLQVDLVLSENISKNTMRGLYGIVGISEGNPNDTGYRRPYDGFYIPEENQQALMKVLSGMDIFRKYITEEQIPVLSAIYKRTKELQDRYGERFHPRFTIKESAQRANVSEYEAKNQLGALTGILTEITKQHIFDTTSKKDYSFRTYTGIVNKWFISRARMPLVEKVLEMF